MNGMWGYKVSDIDYKSTNQLIELLVRSAAKGSNLLLNIGPQPNGELPALALDRLQVLENGCKSTELVSMKQWQAMCLNILGV